MERPVSFLNLRNSLIILLIGFTPTFQVNAQLVLRDSLVFPREISGFSIDRTNNLFITLEGGSIVKYSPKLDSLLSYSPASVGSFTLLEAWHGFQIFAFQRQAQEFTLLDRFLSRATQYSLSESVSFFTDLCTISSDQNLWLIEENQLQLHKLNLINQTIKISIPLEPVLDPGDHVFTFIREYQNLVFIVDSNSGMYVFDNLGNYLRKLDYKGVQHLSFSKNSLIFIVENTLHKLDLYRGNHLEYILNETKARGVIELLDGYAVFLRNKVLIYSKKEF